MFKTAFGIPVETKILKKVKTERELLKFLRNKDRKYIQNIVFLGGGTNSVLTDTRKHVVLVNSIKGIKILSENKEEVVIAVSAGENWDEFVKFCVDKKYAGIESLSYIPGSVGASPVQNIGAYGTEVKNVIQKVKVYDAKEKRFKFLTNEDCKFSYRNSIFKEERNRYFITQVIFKLKKTSNDLSAKRREIIKTRKSKLPEVKYVYNCGSFFKNIIIKEDELTNLQNIFPEIPHFSGEVAGTIKIPTGYILDKLGYKDFKFKNLGTYKNNALVLINHGDSSFNDLLEFIDFLQKEVKQKTGLEIFPEPDLFV